MFETGFIAVVGRQAARQATGCRLNKYQEEKLAVGTILQKRQGASQAGQEKNWKRIRTGGAKVVVYYTNCVLCYT